MSLQHYTLVTLWPSTQISLPNAPSDIHMLSHPHQIQRVSWMEGKPAFMVDPSMSFSDIIVPTIDTVCAHFLLEFITNSKPVCVYQMH